MNKLIISLLVASLTILGACGSDDANNSNNIDASNSVDADTNNTDNNTEIPEEKNSPN